MSDAAAAAAAAIASARANAEITVGGAPGAELEPTVFDRLSTTRRVLGHVTDEIDDDQLGPRNTLAAISSGVWSDPHTDLSLQDGETVEQAIERVLEHLNALLSANLIVQRDDGSYEVTDAGRSELAA